MRIKDRRFHVRDPLHVQAADLLEAMAERAAPENNIGTFWDSQRHHQRNRERMPDAFGNRPGAFIQERCTPEQREVLKHLRSDPDAYLPDFFRWILRPGHPDNKIGGVLEWSPATVWTFT